MARVWLGKLVSIIDRITDLCGRIVAWFTLAVVVLTFAIVVLRYGFNLGWIAMQESVLYLHGLVFMLGAAFAFKEDAHVRVDIFYQKFSALQKAWVNLVGTLVLLLPVCIFIYFVSVDYVIQSWQIMESSPEPGGLPMVFISKSYIFVFVLALCLQGIAEICRNVLLITEGKH